MTCIAPFQLFVLACGASIHLASQAVHEGGGALRAIAAAGLAPVAGAIVLGYRFVILLITLYAA